MFLGFAKTSDILHQIVSHLLEMFRYCFVFLVFFDQFVNQVAGGELDSLAIQLPQRLAGFFLATAQILHKIHQGVLQLLALLVQFLAFFFAHLFVFFRRHYLTVRSRSDDQTAGTAPDGKTGLLSFLLEGLHLPTALFAEFA